ncbi:hypothetical protein ACM66B_006674 [Microbotryomycetes sp. NB124-2]
MMIRATVQVSELWAGAKAAIETRIQKHLAIELRKRHEQLVLARCQLVAALGSSQVQSVVAPGWPIEFANLDRKWSREDMVRHLTLSTLFEKVAVRSKNARVVFWSYEQVVSTASQQFALWSVLKSFDLREDDFTRTGITLSALMTESVPSALVCAVCLEENRKGARVLSSSDMVLHIARHFDEQCAKLVEVCHIDPAADDNVDNGTLVHIDESSKYGTRVRKLD